MKKPPRTASNRPSERNSELLRRKYLGGESYKAISTSVSMSYSSLTGLIQKERERIVKHFEGGIALEDIAAEYGFPVEEMLKLIQAQRDRDRIRREEWDVEEAEMAYEQEMYNLDYGVTYTLDVLSGFEAGEPAEEVAERYGIHVSDYYRHLGLILEAVKNCKKLRG